MEEQLSLLKRLWEQGLITEEDLSREKQQLLDRFESVMIAEESSDLSSALRVRCGRQFKPERKASHEPPSASLSRQWPLPAEDDWSTPFAEVLLTQLDLRPGLTILDIAAVTASQPSTWLNRLGRPAPSSESMPVGQVANARTLQRGAALAPV